MSAFVVDPKTINQMLSVFTRRAPGHHAVYMEYTQKAMAKLLPDWDTTSREGLADLGQALYNVNINAVAQRYPGDTIDTLPGTYEDDKLVPYRYQREDCSLVQCMKAMNCWHYQASEGNVPEQKLYKAFEQIALLLAAHIVKRTEEYDKAVW